MPTLLKHLARNLLVGVTAGWMTLGLLIYINTGGLREILFSSSDPALALMLLMFGFAITFGSLAMGASIMMLPYGGDHGRGRGLKIDNLLANLKNRLPRGKGHQVLAPVPVKEKR